MLKSMVTLGVLAASGLATGTAFAQTAEPATSAPAEQEGGLADIVVTAQKRSESVQEVPITITAITGGDLVARGIENTENLTYVVPGLNINRQQQSAVVYLRGLGTQSASIGDENNVATYIDGVYLFSPDAFFTDFNNIERVEVLKGPQGTLYGRNATGGLIHVVTRTPTQDLQFEGSVGFGNYDTVEARAYLAGGIGENIAADIAVTYADQGDGFGYNRVIQTDIYKRHNFGVRSKWVFDLGEDTRLTLIGDYTKLHSDFGTSRRPLRGAVLAGGATPHEGFYISPNDFKSDSFVKTYGGSATLEHDFGWAQFKSVTAIRRGKTHMIIDQDGSPLPVLNLDYYFQNEQFSQEVQILAPVGNRLKWIIGAFYLDAAGHADPTTQFGAAFAAFGGGQTLFAESGVKSLSAFAQATYDIFPNTNLTIGGRYTRDRRHIEGFTRRFNGVIPPTSIGDQRATYSKPTWRVALDHQFENVLVYASYNRGFKAGNFNSTSVTSPPVKPEKVDAYEIGFKSDLLGRTLRVNGSAFYYSVSNLQAQANRGSVNLLTNAAKATIKGVELEIAAVPTDGLTLTAGMTALDAKYDDYPGTPATFPVVNAMGVPIGGNTTGVLVNGKGNHLIRTPSLQVNASFNYVVPVSFGELTFNATYFHSGKFYWEADNRVSQKAYDIVNGRIGWQAPDGAYGISIWGKNLTKARYETFVSTSGLGDQGAPGEPRTYGATLSFKF